MLPMFPDKSLILRSARKSESLVAVWLNLSQITAMHTPMDAMKPRLLLTSCLPEENRLTGKQITRRRALHRVLNLFRKNGAGEGIRTLDPNLGKVVLYP